MRQNPGIIFAISLCFAMFLPGRHAGAQKTVQIELANNKTIMVPRLREKAVLAFAPAVPPSLKRKEPALVEVHLEAAIKRMEIKPGVKYDYWTFNGDVPGPFIRARVGDTIEVHITSSDPSGMPHALDFQSVTGPEGGAIVTTVVKGEKKIAWFRLMHPGLFLYYCTAQPAWDHMANGMYGLMLVEPADGLPVVDKEFYVMQSEIYGDFIRDDANLNGEDADKFWEEEPDEKNADHFHKHVSGGMAKEEGRILYYSREKALAENPSYVFFNGRYRRHIGWNDSLKANVRDRVRIYFGNAGPNLISSFRVDGEIFDRVYRDADLISPPALSIQTTLVPPGGATVVDIKFDVPGEYMLIDHSIFRAKKGAYGRIIIEGDHNYNIYAADEIPEICPEC